MSMERQPITEIDEHLSEAQLRFVDFVIARTGSIEARTPVVHNYFSGVSIERTSEVAYRTVGQLLIEKLVFTHGQHKYDGSWYTTEVKIDCWGGSNGFIFELSLDTSDRSNYDFIDQDDGRFFAILGEHDSYDQDGVYVNSFLDNIEGLEREAKLIRVSEPSGFKPVLYDFSNHEYMLSLTETTPDWLQISE